MKIRSVDCAFNDVVRYIECNMRVKEFLLIGALKNVNFESIHSSLIEESTLRFLVDCGGFYKENCYQRHTTGSVLVFLSSMKYSNHLRRRQYRYWILEASICQLPPILWKKSHLAKSNGLGINLRKTELVKTRRGNMRVWNSRR